MSKDAFEISTGQVSIIKLLRLPFVKLRAVFKKVVFTKIQTNLRTFSASSRSFVKTVVFHLRCWIKNILLFYMSTKYSYVICLLSRV
jgi:hypothetical protein